MFRVRWVIDSKRFVITILTQVKILTYQASVTISDYICHAIIATCVMCDILYSRNTKVRSPERDAQIIRGDGLRILPSPPERTGAIKVVTMIVRMYASELVYELLQLFFILNS